MDFTIAAEGGGNGDYIGGDGCLKPWKIMVGIQLCNALSNLLFKKIFNHCFIVPTLTYRNIIAALSIAPLALYYEREAWKDLTWKEIFCFIMYTFPLAICQVTLALLSLYYGMRETTAALSSNIMNITPIVAFMIAMFTRGWRLNLRSRARKLKVLGALICIGGTILSMIKYPTVHSWYGILSLLGAGFASAIGQILQGILFEASSAKYWTTTLVCLFGSLQTAAIGVFVNTTMDDWMLKLDLQLFTLLYSGFLNTVAAYFMISWVIPKRGYIYPCMFTSLSVFVTAIAECQMGEHTSIRSFVGMIIIIGGLHLFLRAKDNEEQEEQAEEQRHVSAPKSRDICTCHICGHRHRRICTCHGCGHRHNVPESREPEGISELSQVDESASSEDIPEQVDESASTENISETNQPTLC